MKCDIYKKFWLGEMSEQEFAAHRALCAECEQAYALDNLLEEEARELPVPEMSDGLWEKVVDRNQQSSASSSVRSEKRAQIFYGFFDPRQHTSWKLAALLVISIGISVYSFTRTPSTTLSTEPQTLLTYDALVRVEIAEQEYLQAITDLEATNLTTEPSADIELTLRYRSRLETIDAQIERCKKALQDDRANAHVQRYLLAAYQDKQETLTELASLTQR